MTKAGSTLALSPQVQSLLLLLLLLLLSHVSRVRLCATLQTAAHQAPPSYDFKKRGSTTALQSRTSTRTRAGNRRPSVLTPRLCQPCFLHLHSKEFGLGQGCWSRQNSRKASQDSHPLLCMTYVRELCIGLAKNVIQVFLSHLAEKPKRISWPTQHVMRSHSCD